MTSIPSRFSQHGQRGYSLAEVLIAVAVFTVIFVATLMVYDRANRVFKSGVDASDVQQTTRVAFERLVADLRMAGFDFDRDGYPMGAKKYQQPDEQLEFIHPNAITIRTNLNYESAAANDNGRETAYEPGFATTATDADDYFPIVTTANNEVVTYVLKSDNGANNDTIRFFMDKRKPRRAYPEPTAGGANEEEVVIPGVNLCPGGCLSPPYTLYRITLNDNGDPDLPGVPIANNIRSVNFSYFADALSSVAITPNGGTGQFMVIGGSTPTAALTARELRGGIRSIVVNLVGMSPGSDPNYREPIEAALPVAQRVASAERHRQYRLESTVVPRNLGKRGVQEIDIRAPGAPNITRVCQEGCGAPRVEWDAPPIGYVNGYFVVYDESPTGSFNSPGTDAGKNLYGYPDNLDPTKTYYFKVIAKNDFGSQMSLNFGGPLRPLNRTKPQPPAILSVTGSPAPGAPAAVANDIVVTWSPPTLNVGAPTGPLNSCSMVAFPPLKTETKRFKLYRAETSGFTPDDATNMIWSGMPTSSTGPALVDSTTGVVTFTDSGAKKACVAYYYKVKAVERCNDDPTFNVPNNADLGISDASPEGEGRTTAGGSPKAPADVHTTIASTCSTTGCSVALEWDQVTEDTNNKPIIVSDYTVRRQTYVNNAPSGGPVTFSVTDVNLADGIVTYTDSPAPPAPLGTVHHYTVAATHCAASPVVSTFSTPDAKFPCAVVTPTLLSGPLIEGDGNAASPWVVNSDTASVQLESNVDITTAVGTFYDVSAPATRFPATITVTGPRTRVFSFSMTGATGVFGIDMQLTDVNNCGTTVTRYFQESPTMCCLLPYKLPPLGTTIFDPTVVTLNPTTDVVTIRLRNQCDVALAVDTFRFRWTVGSNNNYLLRVVYPGGIVDNFAGIPNTTGLAALNPALVGASATIPANGDYRVALHFRHNQTTLDTVTDFCARYTRPGIILPDDCQVAQIADDTCPF